MKTHFEILMTKKTIDELLEYINNSDRYLPDALTAAINELKARGHNFSDDQLNSLNEKIKQKKEFVEDDNVFSASKSLRKNEVKDPNAPLLYSQIAIILFSSIFTVIFGSILLSLNVNNRSQKIKVICFGILFTGMTIAIGNFAPHPTLFVLFINVIGGYILAYDLWIKYVGRETQYRAKPIWIPMIISIMISLILLIAMIYN